MIKDTSKVLYPSTVLSNPVQQTVKVSEGVRTRQRGLVKAPEVAPKKTTFEADTRWGRTSTQGSFPEKIKAQEVSAPLKGSLEGKIKSSGDAVSVYQPSTQRSGKATYNLSFGNAVKNEDSFINQNSPFASYKITSKSGARNTGIKGASTMHAGIDRAVPEGTGISLPIATTFLASGYDDARGNWIEVKDGAGNILHFQHLKDYGTFTPGEVIPKGVKIARSGASGVGSGAHLHEEYYSADGKNITESYWAEYTNGSVGALLGKSAMQGVSGLTSELMNTLDMAGAIVTPKTEDNTFAKIYKGAVRNAVGGTNPATRLAVRALSDITSSKSWENVRKSIENDSRKYSEEALREANSFETPLGRMSAKGANLLIDNGIRQLPGWGLAVLSGGTTKAAEGAKGMAKVLNWVRNMGRNPAFWSSYVQTAGGVYGDALSNGATERQAITAGSIVGLFNAAIEVGGGIEKELGEGTIQRGFKNLFKQIGKTAFEEGREEVFQGIVENGVNKFVYKHNAPWFSLSDNDAVINPKRMGTEALAGAFMGSVFSGGRAAINTVADIVHRVGDARKINSAFRSMTDDEKTEFQKSFASFAEKAKSGAYENMTVEQMQSDEDFAKVKSTIERFSINGTTERFSIHNIDGKTRIFVDNDITRGEIQADTPKKIKQFILENYDKVKLKNKSDTGVVYITDRGASEYAYSRSTKSLAGVEKYDKWRMADNIDEMIASGIQAKYENATHQRKDNIIGFYRTPIEIQVEDRVYDIEMVTAITKNNTEEFYDVVNLQLKKKGESHPTLTSQSENGRRGGNLPSMNSIRSDMGNVKLNLTESQINFTRKLGLGVESDVTLDANGKIILSDGRIVVSPYSSIGGFELISHEVTHWLKVQSPKEYQRFVNILKTEFAEEWKSTLGKVRQDYYNYAKTHDNVDTSPEVIEEETAARFAERLDNNAFIEMVANTDLSVAVKIRNALKSLIEKIKRFFTKADAGSAQDVNRLIKAKRAWERACIKVAKNAKKEVFSKTFDERERYSFAGRGAKVADIKTLADAKALYESGASNEDVFYKTGWFVGQDGEWRFEIDDSEAVFYTNPNLATKGDNEYGFYKTGNLSDILYHDELYKAYPFLGNYTVIIQETESGVQGSTFPEDNQIVLSDILFLNKKPNPNKQARIKEIEATPEYKEYSKFYDDDAYSGFAPEEWLKLEEEARNKFFSSDLGKEYYNLNWGKSAYITAFELTENGKAVLMHEIQHAIQAYEGFERGTNPEYWKRKQGVDDKTANELYQNTAGEIEAREVSDRLGMTEEERKQSFPYSAKPNKDIVFANDRGVNNDIIILDNGNTYIKASRKVISGNDISVWRTQITKFFDRLIDKKGSLDIPTLHGDVLTITKRDTADKARDNYIEKNRKRVKMSDAEFKVKLNAEAHIDEIAKTSKKDNKPLSKDTKNHKFAKNGFEYRTAYFEDFDGQYYKLTLSVGHNGSVATVYNIGKINKNNIPSATKIVAVVGSKPLGMLSTDNISQDKDNVKGENTYQTDENGKPLYKIDEKRNDEYNEEQARGRDNTATNKSFYERVMPERSAYEAKVADNKKLTEMNDKLRKLFKNATKIRIDAFHISDMAKDIKKKYESHIGQNVLETRLNALYRELAEKSALAGDDVERQAALQKEIADGFYNLAYDILEQADMTDRTMYNAYKDLRKVLRTKGISIAAQDARDIPDFFDFVKRNMNRVKISSKGQDVDSFYEELCEEYPEWFDRSITAPSDRLLKIVEVRDQLDPKVRDLANIEDAATLLGNEMYLEYWNGKGASEAEQMLADMFKNEYIPKMREDFELKMFQRDKQWKELVDYWKNRDERVAERIRVIEPEERKNLYTDTETKEYEGVVKKVANRGVKLVRRKSADGKSETVVPTFERVKFADLKENEEFRRITKRILKRQRTDESLEEGNSGFLKFGFSLKSIWRAMEKFYGDKDFPIMKELVLDKFEDSKMQYLYIVEFYANELYDKIEVELGIQKGSELSALVQKFGEKTLTTEEMENISEEDMEKIRKADKWFRWAYDGLIEMINDTRRAIYPNAEKRAKKLEEEIDKLVKQIDLIELGFMTGDFSDVSDFDNHTLERIDIKKLNLQERRLKIQQNARVRISAIEKTIEKTENAISNVKNKGTVKQQQLANSLAYWQTELQKAKDIAELSDTELANEIENLNKEFTSNAAVQKEKMINKIVELKDKLKNKELELLGGDVSYGHIIEKRKDYYRHFQELGQQYEGMKSYLQKMTNNGMDFKDAAKETINWVMSKRKIDIGIEGVTADTRPRASYRSFAQHRSEGDHNAYKYDAVGGFLEYLPAATYSGTIDPQISIFRGIADELAKPNSDGNTNDNSSEFVGYLRSFANNLAGKSTGLDRTIKEDFTGRPIFDLTNSIVGNWKAGLLMGNVGSMFAQMLNLTNATAQIKNPKCWAMAAADTIAWYVTDKRGTDGKIKERVLQSQFLNERYNDYFSRFEHGAWAGVKKKTNWMMQFFDELTGRLMWNAAYNKALDAGYPMPIRYADDFTRRCIGGRGIGELQLIQNSKVFTTVFPFTVEVMNTMDVIGDIIHDGQRKGKKAAQVASTLYTFFLYFISNMFLNKLMEFLRGTDGGLIDPFGVAYRGIRDDKGGLQIAGEIAGNAINATWYGQALVSKLPENSLKIGDKFTLPGRNDIFGSEDPTRFGTSGSYSYTDIFYLIPGGNQMVKTWRGYKALKRGVVKSKNGKELYTIERTPRNIYLGLTQNKFSESEDYYAESFDIYRNYLKTKTGLKDEHIKEFERLADIDDGVMPDNVKRQYQFDGLEYKLNDSEYKVLNELYGYRAVQYRNAVIDSAEYKMANDALKVVMMKKAMSQAEKDGKAAYVTYSKTGTKNLKGTYKNEFAGKTILGNNDTADVYAAEGMSKGKGYAEVEIDGKEYVLQGDKYNAYEKARYESYTKMFDSVEEGTITFPAEERTRAEIKEYIEILLNLFEKGTITAAEYRQIVKKVAKGEEFTMPAVAALGTQEYVDVYLKKLSGKERKSKIASLRKKVKDGKMSLEEYKAICKGEQTIKKLGYISDDYRSLTTEQRDKVDAKMNKKAKEEAGKSVKIK